MKILGKLVALALSLSTAGVASGNTCRPMGCENCAISIEGFDNNLIINMTGNELPSIVGHASGSNTTYSGPAQGGFVSFGPYYDQLASKLIILPRLVLSTDWRPDTYRTCKKRDYKKKCVGWNHRKHETGFTIDYVVNGVGIYSTVKKNQNSLNKATFYLPPIKCDGSIDDLQIRVYGAYGGSVDFTVHEMVLDTRWND